MKKITAKAAARRAKLGTVKPRSTTRRTRTTRTAGAKAPAKADEAKRKPAAAAKSTKTATPVKAPAKPATKQTKAAPSKLPAKSRTDKPTKLPEIAKLIDAVNRYNNSVVAAVMAGKGRDGSQAAADTFEAQLTDLGISDLFDWKDM